MCYYARADFVCGDWKWGNMMERCTRQHRTGETCGAKLTHPDHITSKQELCRTCQDIEVKCRRLRKVEENISRWKNQKEQFGASLAKAEGEQTELVEKIKELQLRRPKVLLEERPGDGSKGSARAPVALFPSLPIPANAGSSYMWTSSPQAYSFSNQNSNLAGGYSNVSGTSLPRSDWQGGSGRHSATYSK